jgi:hypothetical protein
MAAAGTTSHEPLLRPKPMGEFERVPMTPADFHARFPSFAPFVGTRYADRLRDDTGPRLLLIGESHYLPEGAALHHDPDTWYASNERDLLRQQDDWALEHPDDADDWRAWIHTAAVVRNACEQNFANQAHWIWKNAFEVINDAGPRYPEPREVAHDIAFLNFFVRPARTGASLKGHLSPLDVRLANDVLAHRIAELRPTAIAFISRFAAAKCDDRTTEGIPRTVTPHPTSPWWNRASDDYGNLRGRDFLDRFVREIWRGTTTKA